MSGVVGYDGFVAGEAELIEIDFAVLFKGSWEGVGSDMVFRWLMYL